VFRRKAVAEEHLWLPEAAFEAMVSEAESWAPDETGGVFMGYEADGGVVVTDLIDAGPDALRSPTSFAPDAAFQLEEIGRIYAQSGRVHTYIGDWHTHPEGSSMHSFIDRAAMREVARSREARCTRPLMFILGGDESWSGIAWRYEPGRWWGRVVPMIAELY